MPFIRRRDLDKLVAMAEELARDYREAAELAQFMHQEKLAVMRGVPVKQADALEDLATILENEQDNGLADGTMYAVGKMRKFAAELRRGAEELHNG